MKNEKTARSVAIIGGGAAGLAAAISAGEAGAKPVIIEKANRVGKKLLKTGNGRCNLSNENVSPAGYDHGDFVAPLLEETPCAALRERFRALGLWTTVDGEGRVYPRSDTASSVLDILRLAAAERGAEERCSAEVTAIRPLSGGGFRIEVREGAPVFAERVIVSTGGGTELCRALGHKQVPFTPILCPLKTETAPIRGLSGLRVRCRARLLHGEEALFDECGEILFRDFGVSGILALDISRFLREGCTLSLDLLPEWEEDELRARLREQLTLARPGEELTGVFHRRVAEAVLRYAGGTDVNALCRAIRDFRIPVLGRADTQNAQVTRGGADVRFFDPKTLQSTLCPGLYCVGEALDIDGRCGGYNLHWAFVSGAAAGRSAALD